MPQSINGLTWKTIVLEWLEVNDRSQAWLARRAGISERTMSMGLNGIHTPNPRTLKKLEKAMGLEPGALGTPDRTYSDAD